MTNKIKYYLLINGIMSTLSNYPCHDFNEGKKQKNAEKTSSPQPNRQSSHASHSHWFNQPSGPDTGYKILAANGL